MIYKAIGEESKKVYAVGKHKSECLRKLSEIYPYPQRGEKSKDGKYIDQALPETILIIRGDPNED